MASTSSRSPRKCADPLRPSVRAWASSSSRHSPSPAMTRCASGRTACTWAKASRSTCSAFWRRSMQTVPTIGASAGSPSSARRSAVLGRGRGTKPLSSSTVFSARHAFEGDHALAVGRGDGHEAVGEAADQLPVQEAPHRVALVGPRLLVADDDRHAGQPPDHGRPHVGAEHVAVEDLDPLAAQDAAEPPEREHVGRAAAAEREVRHAPVREEGRPVVVELARGAEAHREAVARQVRGEADGEALRTAHVGIEHVEHHHHAPPPRGRRGTGLEAPPPGEAASSGGVSRHLCGNLEAVSHCRSKSTSAHRSVGDCQRVARCRWPSSLFPPAPSRFGLSDAAMIRFRPD